MALGCPGVGREEHEESGVEDHQQGQEAGEEDSCQVLCRSEGGQQEGVGVNFCAGFRRTAGCPLPVPSNMSETLISVIFDIEMIKLVITICRLSLVSSMAGRTILRVKRLRTQDPSEVLVVSAKKRKTECGEEEDVKILKLAATVEAGQDASQLTEAVSKILAKKAVPKTFEQLKERYKKSCNSKASPVQGALAGREEQRFRLVSQRRAIRLDELEDWGEDQEVKEEVHVKREVHVKGEVQVKEEEQEVEQEMFRLYDVVGEKGSEKQGEKGCEEKISCNGVEMLREYVGPARDEEEYVYDVYYSEENAGWGGGDFDDSLLDGMFSIQVSQVSNVTVFIVEKVEGTIFQYVNLSRRVLNK